MSWLVIILFVAFLIYLYKISTPSSHLWKYGNLIPGPKPLPIVGNGFVFLTGKSMIQTMLNLANQYNSIYRLWLGKKLMVFMTDPKDIEVFLSCSDHLNKAGSYNLLQSGLGNKNMLMSEVEIWKVHRKLLAPSFHFKILENAVGMIEKHGNRLCQQLESQVEQPEFEITEYLTKCSLDIICETAMGIDLQCQSAQHSQYLENMKKLDISILKRCFSPWLRPDIFFRISVYGRMFFDALNMIKPFVRKEVRKHKFVKCGSTLIILMVSVHSLVIIDRKAALINETSSDSQTPDNKTKKPKPFLDYLLLESDFTNEEIEDEVQTIMFAGHDTTKTTLSFCLYELSNNPQVQEKLIQEIDNMITQKGEHLSLQDYSNTKYMDSVIKETLRMYTPVPLIARRIEKDVVLPSGFTLPAGCEAFIFLWFLQINEKNFEDPKTFKPERFDNQARMNPYEFIPFSAGSRSCVGQKFALLELKVLLFKFFQKYRVLPATKHTNNELEIGLVLFSTQGVHIRIARRS